MSVDDVMMTNIGATAITIEGTRSGSLSIAQARKFLQEIEEEQPAALVAIRDHPFRSRRRQRHRQP